MEQRMTLSSLPFSVKGTKHSSRTLYFMTRGQFVLLALRQQLRVWLRGRHYPWLVLWPSSGKGECFSQVPVCRFSNPLPAAKGRVPGYLQESLTPLFHQIWLVWTLNWFVLVKNATHALLRDIALFTKECILEQFRLILDTKDSAAWAIKLQFGCNREKETNICAVIAILKKLEVYLVSKSFIFSLLSV